MTLTHEDRNAMLLLPAVRATRPAASIRRNRAVDQAVSPDGYITDRALLVATNLLLGDDASAATLANASTSVYVAYMTTSIVLPTGTWRVSAKGAVTGSLSGASNLNCQLVLNGMASPNSQLPIAAANQLGTVFTRYSLDNVPGGQEVSLVLQFRPSAGTATVQCGYYDYRAERLA